MFERLRKYRAAEGGAPGGEADGSAVKAAEERAKAAEKRLKDIEAAESKRQADADAAKKRAEAESLDGAKKQLEELSAREKAAQERIAAYEAKEKERLDTRIAQLPDTAKARIEKFRAKLSTEDFAELVEDELTRNAGGAGDDSESMPAFTPGGRAKPVAGERKLKPQTEDLLDKLNVDTRLAKTALDVQHDGNDTTKGRFVMPTKVFINVMNERARMKDAYGRTKFDLNEDDKAKLLDIAKRSKR